MSSENQIVIRMDKFKPRDYQLEFIRAIENKGIKRAVLSWPRRCQIPLSDVLLSNGSTKKMKDIKVGDKILSWNGFEVEEDIVKNVWKTEPKKTLTIKAGKFLPVTTSKDHKFATIVPATKNVSWKKAEDLHLMSHFVMNYAGLKFSICSDPDLAEFIGYMSSDGNMGPKQQPSFTNNNIEILKRVEYLAKKIFNVNVIWRKHKNAFNLGFKDKEERHSNRVANFFMMNGQRIQKKYRKMNPFIWDMDLKSVKRYLAGIISGDGSIYPHEKGFVSKDRGRDIPPSNEITISCGINDEFGWDMYWLLRKIGIIPHIPYKERGSNWKIRVSNSVGLYTLLKDNYIYGKNDKALEILSRIKKHSFNKTLKGCYKSNITKITENEVEEELYDLETEKNHNFFANGYLVHNSGKDVCAWNILIREAIRNVGSYIYCLPSFSMCRRVLLNSKLHDGSAFMDFIPKELILSFNKQEMKISLINGSIIIMVGSDNADQRVVGMAAKGIVISEAALANPVGVSYLLPMVAASNGFFIAVSTPRGKNFFHDMYQKALLSEDWYVSKLTVDDTKHVPLEEIQKIIDSGLMSYELAQQEFWTSFSSLNQGAYYGEYVEKMRLNDQITTVPYEPSLQTYIFMDLGMNDMFTILFVQATSLTIRIFDYYENHSKGLEHYANVIKSKGYGVVKVYAPHDIRVRELTTGISRLEKMRSLGLDVDVVANLPIRDGIEAVRTILPKTYIEKDKCAKLIVAIENYSKEWDESTKMFKDNPKHDRHCFTGDTLITLYKNSKIYSVPIEEVRIGDYAVTPLGMKKITNIFKRKTKKLIDVVVSEGLFGRETRITTTKYHNFFTQKGKVRSRSLRIGNLLEKLTLPRFYLWQEFIEYGTLEGFGDAIRSKHNFGYYGGTSLVSQYLNKNDIVSKWLKYSSFTVNFFARLFRKGTVKNVTELELDKFVYVYDLTVEDEHCYYAERYLVSNSHANDALRYLAVTSNKLVNGMTAEELNDRYERVMRGSKKLPSFFE